MGDIQRRRSVPALMASACAGVALWCSFGALMVAGDGPLAVRAGVLPPWWTLAACVLVPIAVAISVRLSSARALPLLVTAFIIVPWLPISIPDVALLATGPAVWFVWAIALSGVVLGGGVPGWLRALGGKLAGGSERRAPIAAAAVALVVFGVSAWKVSPILPLGDEPHYLIITQSLLKDGDLKIENNHRQGDYRSYWKGNLRPDYLRRGTNGEIYSIHMPGLSVAVLPAFALGGYAGVQILLILLSAAGTVLVWVAARTLTGDAGAAWFAWVATGVTVPFVFLSFTVFPDGAGSVLVMLALFGIVAMDAEDRAPRAAGAGGERPSRSIWFWGGLGASCAILPWLHPRYAVLAAAIGLVTLARIVTRPRAFAAAAAFLTLPLVSALGWFGYYDAIYGSVDPSIAYGNYTQMEFGHIASGVAGLLFDQQFGLIPNAPVYALALVGMIPLCRTRPRFSVELAIVIVPYTLVTAAYHMWWGGSSSPARFLGPILLPLSLPMAAAWTRSARLSTRVFNSSLLALSVVMTIVFVGMEQGRFAFNSRDGFALWLAWVSPGVNAARGIPSLFRGTLWTAVAEASIWIACGLAAWLLARALDLRARLSPGAIALLTPACIVVLGASAMAASWHVERADFLAPVPGQLAVLRAAASGRRPVAITYRRFALVAPDEVTRMMRLRAAGSIGTATETWLWFPRMPGGTYRLALENQVKDSTLTLSMSIGRESQPITTWAFTNLDAGLFTHDFDLPADVRSISIRAETVPPRSSSDIWLQPLALHPAAGRSSGLVATSARRYGPTVVYALGEDVYLEPPGIWAAAETDAEIVMVAADGRREQPVLLKAGPVRTTISLLTGDSRQSLTLEPGEAREIAIPVAAGGVARVRVRTDRGFRPADTDPRSTDSRYLGVWIEIR
jgi:hypothetical protein